VEADAMHLPEVEVIGLQPAQGLFEHRESQRGASAVGADFRHEKDFAAPALEAAAEPILGPAVPILPAGVAKGNAGIGRFMDEANGFLDRLQVAEMMSAQAKRRDLNAGTAQRPLWNRGHGKVLPSHASLLRGSRGG